MILKGERENMANDTDHYFQLYYKLLKQFNELKEENENLKKRLIEAQFNGA